LKVIYVQVRIYKFFELVVQENGMPDF